MKKKDIEILQIKTATHAQTLAKEAAETDEINQTITLLTSQRSAHLATKTSLLTQISETQALIDTKLSQQRAHAMHLSQQSRHDVPELEFWQSNLGLRLEGVGQSDRLKFVFTHVDERDWEREAWFELGLERRDYEVVGMRPKLEAERVEKVVEQVNEMRELGVLLKGMRELFVEAMKN